VGDNGYYYPDFRSHCIWIVNAVSKKTRVISVYAVVSTNAERKDFDEMNLLTMLGIPCNYDVIYRPFMISILYVIGDLYDREEDILYSIEWADSCYIWDMRNELARKLLDSPAQYLFMFDVDMAFPPDTVYAAIEAAKRGAKIIGLPYKNKTGEKFHIYRNVDEYKYKPILAFPTDFMEVDAVGTGLIMIHREVFEKMPPPWFEGFMREESGVIHSEDMVFCKKARELGYKIITRFPTDLVRHLKVQ